MKYTVLHKGQRVSRHKTIYAAIKQVATLQQPGCKECKSVRACMNKLTGGVGKDTVTCQRCAFSISKREFKGAAPDAY